MDRFPLPNVDKVYTECDHCHREIYYNSEYKKLHRNGITYHVHEECYDDFVYEYFDVDIKIAGEKE